MNAAKTKRRITDSWHAVCALESILVGTGVGALVDDVPVAVLRPAEDLLFALGNVDPFSGASVLSRGILGDIGGELVIASPVYKQHFRLADGVCIEDRGMKIPVFPVAVADGEVFVKVAANA